MTANTVHFSKQDCPIKEYHGNPFRYCGSCNWNEETEPIQSPDYVFDIIESWASGLPLDFRGHTVPVDVQRRLEEVLANKKNPHHCIINASVDQLAYREQYVIGCECHEGNLKHIWQPGDEPYVCPTAGTVVIDPRTLIPQGD